MTKPTGPATDAMSVLRPGQHGAAAGAIAAGDADYPTFRHVFPDPRRRARALRAFFSATVRDGIPLGSALSTWRGPHVAATALWLPPGGFPWSTRRKLAATPARTRVLLADPRAFPAFMRYGANVERAQPSEPHWYLEVLSVRPEYQRQGLGSRLVRPIIERADRDEMRALPRRDSRSRQRRLLPAVRVRRRESCGEVDAGSTCPGEGVGHSVPSGTVSASLGVGTLTPRRPTPRSLERPRSSVDGPVLLEVRGSDVVTNARRPSADP